MTPNERLAQARLAAGYEKPADAARALGVKLPTYYGHENGAKGTFRNDAAARYARKFKVNLEWLLTGKGPMRAATEAPVLGYVGAGAEVLPIDDHELGAALDTIDVSVPQDVVALIIRGESQYPLKDGWVVLYSRDYDGVPDSVVGKLCVVKVHEGPTLLKTVRRGRTQKFYTLESWNAPLREDTRLDWASPVIEIRPR